MTEIMLLFLFETGTGSRRTACPGKWNRNNRHKNCQIYSLSCFSV